MELEGKVALITGASRGIGASIAFELGKRGANLFLVHSPGKRGGDGVAETVDKINKLGVFNTIRSLGVDLAQPDAPQQVVTACVKAFEKVDILVNNAGVDLLGSMDTTTIEEYDRLMNINLRAPFFLVQGIKPHLRAPARIINVSSIAARSGFPAGVAYSMSKAGLEGMTRSMAKGMGADGMTVNAVAPGVVETEMVSGWEKEWLEEDAARTPIGRRNGKPDDIAQTVAWLASEGSRWISGQTILCCGGAVMN